MYKTLQIGRKNFIISTGRRFKMLEIPGGITSKKGKRFRIAFTTEQVNYLEIQFKKFPYISNTHREELAAALNIPEKAVKVWFQNRRMKEKKENAHRELNEERSKDISPDFEGQNDMFTSTSRDLQQHTNVYNSHCDSKLTNSALSSLKIMSAQNSGEIKEQDTSCDRDSGTRQKMFSESKQSIYSPDHLNSVIFSSDLCKKFKNKTIGRKKISKSDSVKETRNIVHGLDSNSTNHLSLEQNVPQNWSFIPKMNRSTINNIREQNRTCKESIYFSAVPNVPSQTYYPNGVLWNPTNAASTIASVSSATPPATNQRKITNSTAKEKNKCCDCNCHMNQTFTSNLQKQYSGPQYIITAIPLPNTSASIL